jgi:hemerythrin-like domain-containing protein
VVKRIERTSPSMTASPLSLTSTPAAGFEQPFEMLAACHERVERSLALLDRLAEHLTTHAADDNARSAARDVLRYFDLAAPQHHEDEQRHVLPLLRAQGQAALADRLQADHARLAQAWLPVRAALQAVVRGDAAAALAQRPAWRAFAALHREHAALEEREAFPAARGATGAAAERAMGQEMAQRRGVVGRSPLNP